MNEHEVRALVRAAVERHLGRSQAGAPVIGRARPESSQIHPSHIRLEIGAGSEIDDGMCVIEPVVRCSHCGFCQSYGH